MFEMKRGDDMQDAGRKMRLLIFIVAYNAETTIEKVLHRIPRSLLYKDEYDVEVLVIDDSSRDRTFETGYRVQRNHNLPFKLQVLVNPINQGYGGNQKIGFRYAIEHKFDVVALIHGDGQYAPELLPQLLEPLAKDEADAVFGSRMLMRGQARNGGMPLYKYLGNKILTWFQNRMMRTNLSEFHSGYRLYSIPALRRIPFDLNTNVFHFDTEIIVQLILAGQRIKELPIPTYYGDEICYVNGMRYAWDVVVTTAKARLQEMNLFYDRKYDCQTPDPSNMHYEPKLGYPSTHQLLIDSIAPNTRVLDLGCAGGYLGAELRKKGCHVTGVDLFPLGEGVELDNFVQHDLNAGVPPVDLSKYQCILMMDIIEHLLSPERFIEKLHDIGELSPDVTIFVSTGNVGFVLTRLGLLMGMFNYGKRGILDITHTRLFTFATIRRLFEQRGFDVLDIKGVPVPFPLAMKNRAMARVLQAINCMLIRLRPSLFSFQSFLIVKPRPSLAYLLQQARIESGKRVEVIERFAAAGAVPSH
jgi:glycosyltransferase involved in cell wall biosynthesis